ncbi:protein Smaug homolog 2 isoform X1 [Silurus meridionalis]|uniref:protein Smaug homolog 2 isoform X1 n=1 Tax=Silurus meridionalis TaxID=175797 RepID=UPI001EEB005B|nr:protein Smaug homolog 2 isoform X1 [Silurus meridionalis]XP_046719406.1 protein Smaug homolog 2 isoform X1 [Silurus meridionalis]XP_046719407.1 protein Smaug homolog 2 isoform X1 [Silurus meridionalis]
MMFRDQVGILTDWFKGWNECEQTVALLSLLKRVSRTQARFLHICLEHWLADCTEIHLLEAEANNAAIVSQWQQEPKEKVVSLLLSHLPLLQPRNSEVKCEYMKLLQQVLSHTIESSLFVEESRQLLSYALIHPATTLDDRTNLALWLNHLEEHLSARPPPGPYHHHHHARQGSDEWTGPTDSLEVAHAWHDKSPSTCSSPAGQNGHMGFPSAAGVPSPINSTGLSGQVQPSSVTRSMSLVPGNQPGCSSDWLGQDEVGGRQGVTGAEHAPLSPQGSVASSGSEQTEDQTNTRNTFQEDGSGMKDVPTWLKSLRLHKYASLFSQMSYEEMMVLTEQHLESQNVTKGARHKIALSIQKLRERQSVLKSLEKDILEGGNVRNALQELQQIVITPIKAYSPTTASQREVEPTNKAANTVEEKDASVEGFQSHNPSPCDGETSSTPISEGDIPGQFTRVMGKVCTQLLVSRPDEENISCYLQLIEKCSTHEAFTETQKKRLASWKQQVLKLLRLFPRKAMLDMPVYRQKGWAYGSNSLPTAGSVAGGVSRRGQRQFPLPPRGAPLPSRMGIITHSPRHTLANQPALSTQGRQNLWFGNPGGSNSMPSQSRSSVQRTHSLPVHTSPQTMLLFQQPGTHPFFVSACRHTHTFFLSHLSWLLLPECAVPGTDLEINPTLESLCLSMTEHALGDGMDRTSTI